VLLSARPQKRRFAHNRLKIFFEVVDGQPVVVLEYHKL
jgi:hypothetical protein